MKIGELAHRVGVNIQTVRYYERRGLLPEPERTDSGYREYDGHDIHRMEFILRAKALGFTLTEIRELMDLRVNPTRTAEDVRARALEKIADTEAKIRGLEEMRSGLQRLVSVCEAHGPVEECALMHTITATDHDHGE